MRICSHHRPVLPLKSPHPDVYRKLFIVTVNILTFQVWWRRVRGKDPEGFRFKVHQTTFCQATGAARAFRFSRGIMERRWRKNGPLPNVCGHTG